MMNVINIGKNSDENSSSILNVLSDAKGTYTLLIFVNDQKQVVIGKIGVMNLSRGYYVYTGSAFGKGSLSLGGRIRRHIRKQKVVRWHIDYLLSDEGIDLKAIVAGVMRQKMECAINQGLRDTFHAQIPFSGFGSSDCAEHCDSHLLYLGQTRNVVEGIVELYSVKTAAEIFVLRFQ
jgi:Uri superfamily endonuclease